MIKAHGSSLQWWTKSTKCFSFGIWFFISYSIVKALGPLLSAIGTVCTVFPRKLVQFALVSYSIRTIYKWTRHLGHTVYLYIWCSKKILQILTLDEGGRHISKDTYLMISPFSVFFSWSGLLIRGLIPNFWHDFVGFGKVRRAVKFTLDRRARAP